MASQQQAGMNLAIFQQPALPAHINDFLDTEEGNIKDRSSVPALGIKGKVFEISVNGEKQRVERTDPDSGMKVPVQVLPVVVLSYAARRGRSYYPGTYDPNATAQPTCWSADGVKPHDSVLEKQSPKCEGCPMSIKGSKVDQGSGKQMVACAQHRMLAVLPVSKNLAEAKPLRLKIAVTSDWDKTNPRASEGWFAFQQLTDLLVQRGVKHTASLVTRLMFDPDTAYPKLLFNPSRWLSEDELRIVRPLARSEEVAQLVSGVWTPAGVDGVQAEVDSDEEALVAEATTATPVRPPAQQQVPQSAPPAPAPAKKAAPKQKAAAAAPAAPPAADPGHDGREVRYGAPKPQAAAQPAAQPAPLAIEADWDDEGGVTVVAPAASKQAAAPAAAPVSTDVPPDLEELLTDWDE